MATRKTTPKVDKTVENQENPISSEVERPSTETPTAEPEVAKMAPAMEVDETVRNQESPGGVMVDRREPVIVQDSAGISYDLSKSEPELVNPDQDAIDTEKNRIRQTEAALKGDEREKDKNKSYITLTFVSTGLTAFGKVWKKGEVHTFEDTDEARYGTIGKDDKSWLDLTADEQKKRFGRVMFERG